MTVPLSRVANSIRRSPTLIVLLIGTALLLVLLARGLNIGPLHTDVIIQRAWFKEVGVVGFPQRLFDSNQRHVLVGPVYAALYTLFGENDLPYNMIFQASRVFEGVFMAGLVYQLTRKRALSISAGLALMLTLIRVRELYQGINWYIEPTLALLLASSYCYVLAVRKRRPWLIALSLLLYMFSILLYESGIPWIAVNLFVGWLARPGLAWRSRLWRSVRDALPSIVIAGIYTFTLLYVFKPWQSFTPDAGAASPLRVLRQLATVVTFPGLYAEALRLTASDGYFPMIGLFALIAVLLALGAVLFVQRIRHDDSVQAPDASEEQRTGYPALLLLALLMVLSSILIATSQPMGDEVTDRITFGRAAGIMLLYVTLIFWGCSLLRTRWKESLAVALTALILIGPGFAWMWVYQDYAQESRREIDRMTTAVLDVHRLVYSPVYFVIVTDPDQQKVWAAGGSATIDILKTGAYPETYINKPGTCDNVDGVASAGVCMDQNVVHPTRWALQQAQPNDNVVIVHYDARAGTMTIIPEITLADLPGYNFTSAGPTSLRTNPKRVAVPIPGVNAATGVTRQGIF